MQRLFIDGERQNMRMMYTRLFAFQKNLKCKGIDEYTCNNIKKRQKNKKGSHKKGKKLVLSRL